jgi:hypothetical protein
MLFSQSGQGENKTECEYNIENHNILAFQEGVQVFARNPQKSGIQQKFEQHCLNYLKNK